MFSLRHSKYAPCRLVNLLVFLRLRVITRYPRVTFSIYPLIINAALRLIFFSFPPPALSLPPSLFVQLPFNDTRFSRRVISFFVYLAPRSLIDVGPTYGMRDNFSILQRR